MDMDGNNSAVAGGGDAALVAGVAAGRPAALLELYDRYSPVANALAARVLADRAQAEECTRAAFLELWQRPSPAEPTVDDFRAWLMAAVYRQAAVRHPLAAAGLLPGPPAGTPPARIRTRGIRVARQKRPHVALAHQHAAERAALEHDSSSSMTRWESTAYPQTPLAPRETRNLDGMGDRPAGPAIGINLAGPAPDTATRTAREALIRAGSRPVPGTLDFGSGATLGIDEGGRARRLDERQDHLLVLVGHELKTPITVIKATVQLARGRLAKAGHLTEAAEMDSVNNHIDRLIALVDYLLRAGQLNEITVDLRLARLNLADLVREIAGEMPNATHRVRVQAPEQLILEGDAARLAQVLRNLIGNAIKYSPAGGDVEVMLRRAAETAELCVRDYGIGIPVAERTRVLERFQRAGNVGAIPGFGLGLSMSRDILHAHHGQLWVGNPAAGVATGGSRTGQPAAGDSSGSSDLPETAAAPGTPAITPCPTCAGLSVQGKWRPVC